MKTRHVRTWCLLSAVWLCGCVSAWAQNIPPTPTPIPSSWVEIRPTQKEALESYNWRYGQTKDLLVEGVPVIAVWKSEVEYVFESKPAVLYKSQPGVTERWPKPDVIERLTKQGVSTLRSFRPKGGTPQMKSAIRWHNEQGQPVVYYQMDFARSGWGDFTTPDGKRSPILEDFVADSPWMLRFNHGTLEKAQWGTHRFLNEPMELSLTANLKGKVYFIPTTSKVAPGRGVRVNFTFADWFGGSVTTEVKGCTTLGVPMKVPTPPPGKSESMLLFREIVVNLDPSAQSLCPK